MPDGDTRRGGPAGPIAAAPRAPEPPGKLQPSATRDGTSSPPSCRSERRVGAGRGLPEGPAPRRRARSDPRSIIEKPPLIKIFFEAGQQRSSARRTPARSVAAGAPAAPPHARRTFEDGSHHVTRFSGPWRSHMADEPHPDRDDGTQDGRQGLPAIPREGDLTRERDDLTPQRRNLRHPGPGDRREGVAPTAPDGTAAPPRPIPDRRAQAIGRNRAGCARDRRARSRSRQGERGPFPTRSSS